MKYSHADFEGSPVAVAGKREIALANGLRLLARWHSKEFREPLSINSVGEIELIIKNPDAAEEQAGFCGRYGDALAARIARYNPRTGTQPSNHMSPDNGWCYMNHFDVERMLTDFEKDRS